MAIIESTLLPSRASSLQIRRITSADLSSCLRSGFQDFLAAPTHVLFLSLIYPALGLLLFRATFHYNLIPLLFPAVAGFAILGPVAAVGLYEISRQRELGRAVTWRSAFAVLQAKSFPSIVVLGGLLTALFAAWLGAAFLLYSALLGDTPPTAIGDFAAQIFGTAAGLKLLVIGNLIGALFAVLAFAISVVSFPLLIDRQADAATAMAVSLRAIAVNPMVMLQWGLIVAGALVVGSLPLLMGLPIVMPILGHATWHLYRKIVD